MDSSIKMGTIDPDSLPLVGKMNTFSPRFPSFPPENSVQSSHHYFFRLPAQTDPLGKVISNSHPHRLRAPRGAPLALWKTLPFPKTTRATPQLAPIPVTRGPLALPLTLKSQIPTR